MGKLPDNPRPGAVYREVPLGPVASGGLDVQRKLALAKLRSAYQVFVRHPEFGWTPSMVGNARECVREFDAWRGLGVAVSIRQPSMTNEQVWDVLADFDPAFATATVMKPGLRGRAHPDGAPGPDVPF